MPLKDLFIREGSRLASLHEPVPVKPEGKAAGKAAQNSQAQGTKSAAGQVKTAQVDGYKYTFYDILNHPSQTPGQTEVAHYSVQVGAFKARKSAQEYRDELKRAKHLDCRLAKRGEWTVVLCGDFPTKTAAERSRRQIERLLARECLVIAMS